MIIVGNLNTSLSVMDRTSRQKISKETYDLNNTIDQINLTDIYRTFNPTATEYAFFSSTRGSFSGIDHLGHKTSLNKFKKTEIILSIFWITMK